MVVSSIVSVSGCVGEVDGGGVNKASSRTFTEIIAGLEATEVPSACIVFAAGQPVCTATLVAPSVLLTAGHCVAVAAQWTARCPYAGDTRLLRVLERAVAPTYPGSSATGVDNARGSNVALLRLERDFPATAVAAMDTSASFDGVGVVALGRVSNSATRVMVSRPFLLGTRRTPFAVSVDRLMIQRGDAGGALYDRARHAVLGVSSTVLDLAQCRPGSLCTQWATLAPVAPWLQSTLTRWGVTPVPVGGGDTGEEPPPSMMTPPAMEPPAMEPPPAGEHEMGEGEPPPTDYSGGSSGSDPCAVARDCASCVAVPICGFCNGRCTLGTPLGALDSAVCAGRPFVWRSSQCM